MLLASGLHPAVAQVPKFDISGSCKAAETYDISEDRNKTYKGCMQDEERARSLIDKNWSHYKTKDRTDCVTPAQIVAPSYVEILTCLEMSDETGALLSKDVNQPTGTGKPEPINTPTVPPAMK
jgi:hypothetical protein